MSEIQYKHCNSVGLDQLGLDFWRSRCPFFLIFPCGEIPYILYNLHYDAQVDLEISWSQNISWIRRSDTQLRCPLLKEPKDNMEIIPNGNGCRTLSITLHSKCNLVFCRKCPSRLNFFQDNPFFSIELVSLVSKHTAWFIKPFIEGGLKTFHDLRIGKYGMIRAGLQDRVEGLAGAD